MLEELLTLVEAVKETEYIVDIEMCACPLQHVLFLVKAAALFPHRRSGLLLLVSLDTYLFQHTVL